MTATPRPPRTWEARHGRYTPGNGFADPFQPLDERLLMVGIPEVDSQDALAIIFYDLVVFNTLLP